MLLGEAGREENGLVEHAHPHGSLIHPYVVKCDSRNIYWPMSNPIISARKQAH